MSNGERQRKFQRNNPGYDARRKSRERAAAKRAEARFKEQWPALLKAAEAAEAAKAAAAAQPLALPAPPTRLALPAPVESVEMAAIDELRARLAAGQEPAKTLPVAA
jgi:hypothetical protein